MAAAGPGQPPRWKRRTLSQPGCCLVRQQPGCPSSSRAALPPHNLPAPLQQPLPSPGIPHLAGPIGTIITDETTRFIGIATDEALMIGTGRVLGAAFAIVLGLGGPAVAQQPVMPAAKPAMSAEPMPTRIVLAEVVEARHREAVLAVVKKPIPPPPG